jgi:hypothetical protein
VTELVLFVCECVCGGELLVEWSRWIEGEDGKCEGEGEGEGSSRQHRASKALHCNSQCAS